MSREQDFIESLIHGRDVTFFLPRCTERRIRAAIHRMNAQTQTLDHVEDSDLFCPDGDLVNCLTAMCDMGLDKAEGEDGVEYDELTGCLIDDLDERG